MSSGKFIVRQHADVNSNGPVILALEIDGSEVATSNSTAGLLGGAEACVVKDSSNTVTITFNTPFRNAEYKVFFTPLTAAAQVKPDSIVRAAGSLVYATVNTSDHSTALNDADMLILIVSNDDPSII